MTDYLNEIPNIINAGDSLEFTVKATNYVGTEITYADGYTAYLILNNDSNSYSATSTADTTNGYLFQVASNITSGWTAGNYNSAIYVDNGTNRYPVSRKFIEVKPDLFTSGAYDSRSTAMQIRDALEAAILGQASSNQLSMSIAGRSISRMSLEELIVAKKKYDGFVRDEQRKQDLLEGKSPRTNIQFRWGSR